MITIITPHGSELLYLHYYCQFYYFFYLVFDCDSWSVLCSISGLHNTMNWIISQCCWYAWTVRMSLWKHVVYEPSIFFNIISNSLIRLSFDYIFCLKYIEVIQIVEQYTTIKRQYNLQKKQTNKKMYIYHIIFYKSTDQLFILDLSHICTVCTLINNKHASHYILALTHLSVFVFLVHKYAYMHIYTLNVFRIIDYNSSCTIAHNAWMMMLKAMVKSFFYKGQPHVAHFRPQTRWGFS